RRLLPLDREDQMRALLAVLEDPDPAVRETAGETFAGVAPDELALFVRAAAPGEVELDTLARFSQDSKVLEQVIQHKNVSDITLERLARTVTGGPQEALVVNQVRLLRHPPLIDALFENPYLTADTRRLLHEIREEFFEKEKRRREAEAAHATEEVTEEAE